MAIGLSFVGIGPSGPYGPDGLEVPRLYQQLGVKLTKTKGKCDFKVEAGRQQEGHGRYVRKTKQLSSVLWQPRVGVQHRETTTCLGTSSPSGPYGPDGPMPTKESPMAIFQSGLPDGSPIWRPDGVFQSASIWPSGFYGSGTDFPPCLHPAF